MRAFASALFFLVAQFAPALHVREHQGEQQSGCKDGSQATHFCASSVDHDSSGCAVCAHLSAGGVIVDGALAIIRAIHILTKSVVEHGVIHLPHVISPDCPRGPPPATL